MLAGLLVVQQVDGSATVTHIITGETEEELLDKYRNRGKLAEWFARLPSSELIAVECKKLDKSIFGEMTNKSMLMSMEELEGAGHFRKGGR